MNNIDLTGTDNWVRIGDADIRFTGTFDGNEHTITGLTIVSAAGDTQGMFATIGESGVVKNLGLIDVNSSTGTNNVSSLGGIAGMNEGRIENCYVITGDYGLRGISNIGGLAGFNTGTVQNSYFIGNVSGTRSIGGLAGVNNGTIQNSYSSGSVSGTDGNAGGLVGLINNNAATVQNSYTTVDVNGIVGNFGGIVGLNMGGTGSVQNCVALNSSIAANNGSNSNFRRISASGAGFIVNSYARSDMLVNGVFVTSVLANNSNGADVSAGTEAGQYNNQAFWVGLGFNFTTIWEWNADTGLPILRNMPVGVQDHQVIYLPMAKFTITFAFISDHAPTPVETGLVLYRTSPNTITFTVPAADFDLYDSVEWFIGSVFLGDGQAVTLSGTDHRYNIVGTHYLTVEVVRGGMLYSRNIEFTVVQ
jgi:hypothetical protein